MDEIVGIGSCLSEQVARHFAMNFWGRSVSMVRHNRSDQLVPILNGQAPPKYQDLIDILSAYPSSDPANNEFVFGQSAEGIGRSTNKDNFDLRTVMGREQVGLVLIDNFMDLTADLWATSDGTKFFARFPKDTCLKRLRRLAPSVAAKNYRQIAKRSKEIWPSAHIVFLHFPFSNYPESSSRPTWGASFAQELNLPPLCYAVPPRDVPTDLLKEGQPHHYHHSVYSDIAKEIHAALMPLAITARLRRACSWR